MNISYCVYFYLTKDVCYSVRITWIFITDFITIKILSFGIPHYKIITNRLWFGKLKLEAEEIVKSKSLRCHFPIHYLLIMLQEQVLMIVSEWTIDYWTNKCVINHISSWRILWVDSCIFKEENIGNYLQE